MGLIEEQGPISSEDLAYLRGFMQFYDADPFVKVTVASLRGLLALCDELQKERDRLEKQLIDWSWGDFP